MKTKRRSLIVIVIVALVVVGFVLMISLRHVQLYRVTILPSLGGTIIRPEAINDRGQVVGFGVSRGSSRLLLWDRDNGMQDLGPVRDYALDINNRGHIAGTMKDPNGGMRAFLWSPEDGRRMLGGLSSAARAMNNKGQVVGFSQRAPVRHNPLSGTRPTACEAYQEVPVRQPPSTIPGRSWGL